MYVPMYVELVNAIETRKARIVSPTIEQHYKSNTVYNTNLFIVDIMYSHAIGHDVFSV